jgi:putative ABC transport system permease protein
MITGLRYAFRVLSKDLGFTVIAVLTLALGIGANTAIFTVVNALLLRPLPYEHPNRLVVMYGSNPKRAVGRGPVSLGRLYQLRAESQSFTDLTGYASESFNLTGSDQPEQLPAARVTWNFLRVLGVQPILGRDFLEHEDKEGGQRVVLLGYSLWQRRFGGTPSVVGAAITLDSIAYTIIGVLPAGLDQPTPRLDLLATNLSAFSRFTREQIRVGGGYIYPIARLKTDVNLRQAQAEMEVLTRRYVQVSSGRVDADPDASMVVETLQESIVQDVRPALLILCAAVGAVLLIACANVASLLLARATGRRKEFAVRAALGASRGGLIRQLLYESLVLAFIGGTLGLPIASAGTDLLARVTQINLPRIQEIRIDWQTLAFTFAIAILTGAFFGLMPALQVSKPDLNVILRESGRGTAGDLRSNRVRSFLVVGQVALSIMLLIGASLLIRSFFELGRVDPGFDPHGVLTMQVTLPAAKYPTDSRKNIFFRDALTKISAIPGVTSASAALSLPLNGSVMVPILISGEAPIPFGKRSLVFWQSITPDYFRTLHAKLLRGRAFNEHDNESAAGVAIVNETMARRFWPNQDPIGKQMIVARAELHVQIVGIVADVKAAGLDADARAELYTPYDQRPWPSMALLVRTTGEPMLVASPVRKQIMQVDADLPVTSIRTLDEVVAESFGRRRLTLWLFGAFASTALVLAAIGIYGLLAYSVEQRRQEMGIRQALGARQRDILALILSQGLRLALAGVFIGIAGALALTRLLSNLLFHVSPTDPATFGAVAILFVGVAAMASYLPARRALDVDPLVAMRE